jgi:hypothetical protein
MGKRLLVALGAITASALLVPTGVSASGVEPAFFAKPVYFECLDSFVNHELVAGQSPGWGATAPTRSSSEGGGCIQLDAPLAADNGTSTIVDAAWHDTFKGNIKNLTTRLVFSFGGTGVAVNSVGGAVDLIIDGERVLTDALVQFEPTEASPGVYKSAFTVGGLAPYAGREPGVSTTEHDVFIRLHSFYLDSNPVTVWRYGASDWRSGITFNPASSEAFVISP